MRVEAEVVLRSTRRRRSNAPDEENEYFEGKVQTRESKLTRDVEQYEDMKLPLRREEDDLVSEMIIECGKGRQTVKWLALNVAERMRDNKLTVVAKSLQGVNATKNRASILRPVGLYFSGKLVHPDERIKDMIKNTDENNYKVYVVLAAEVHCSQGGCPDLENSLWQDMAYGRSEFAQNRLRLAEEEKNAETLAIKAKEHEDFLQENQTNFILEIGMDPEYGLKFFNDEDDLGRTARQDWQKLRGNLDKLVQYEKLELVSIRKSLILHYRLLRDAYKLYSGLGNDRQSQLSFGEFMCLLRDSGICEPQDSDLIQRMISPVFEPHHGDMNSSGRRRGAPSLVYTGDMNFNRVYFLEALTRVFLSEELHKLHQARIGIVGNMESLTRSPSQRFVYFMSECAAPILERRIHTRAVHHALENRDILGIFVEFHARLLRVYKKYTNMHGLGRAPSLRLATWNRGSSTSLMRTGSRTARNMSLTPFILMLREANLVVDEDRDDAAAKRENVASIGYEHSYRDPNKFLTYTDPRSEITFEVPYHPLTFADARSLFAASQLENEDSNGFSLSDLNISEVSDIKGHSKDDEIDSEHNSPSHAYGSETSQDNTNVGDGEDSEANDLDNERDIMESKASSTYSQQQRPRSTLEDLSYKEFVEVLVRVAFALCTSHSSAPDQKLRATLQRLSGVLLRRRKSSQEELK